jgi:Doubled CXXCH motif (Paired_CXXCH_1)
MGGIEMQPGTCVNLAQRALGLSKWLLAAALGLCAGAAAWAQTLPPDVPTLFENRGTVGNTRHNLTQRQPAGGGPDGLFMDRTRNDYGEVCVYCHTPHGANRTTTAPLWNRTMRVQTYQTYDLIGSASISQPITQPGVNSLTCLSCHDGQTAVDSVINMPGSGRYRAEQEQTQNDSFLSLWTNPSGRNALTHGRIGTECAVCHNRDGGATGATDFTVFVIGTDLRNDHPVGIRYPTSAGAGTDFKDPPRKEAQLAYFDNNGNTRADSNEIRMYNTGDGYEVECASCHDPHGVPAAGAGSVFNASFLRLSNASSAVCLSCHTK